MLKKVSSLSSVYTISVQRLWPIMSLYSFKLDYILTLSHQNGCCCNLQSFVVLSHLFLFWMWNNNPECISVCLNSLIWQCSLKLSSQTLTLLYFKTLCQLSRTSRSDWNKLFFNGNILNSSRLSFDSKIVSMERGVGEKLGVEDWPLPSICPTTSTQCCSFISIC